MMLLDRVIYKKNAVMAVILCCLAAALATVWPMRLYREEHAYASGLSPVGVTEVITEEQDAGEYFTAQYRHLQTLKFYVEYVKDGEKAAFQLFHVGGNGAMELVAEEEVELPSEIPAYAAVSVDADMVVGDTYVYTIRGMEGSRFTVGCESQSEALATGKAPLYVQGFYNDTGVDDMAVKTSMLYRVPENKRRCAVRALGYLALGLLALLISHGSFAFWERRRRAAGLDGAAVVSVRRALRVTTTPVLAGLFLLSFAAVWPLKLFDSRIPDLLIYETGILLGTGWCLYGLWHGQASACEGRDGAPLQACRAEVPQQDKALHGASAALSVQGFDFTSLCHGGIILCIALLMDRSAAYMNATNDYIHNAAEGWIVVLLAVMTMLMAELPSLLNAATMTTFMASLIGGIAYYAGHAVTGEDPEAAWKNAAALAVSEAIVFGCTAAVSILWTAADAVRNRQKPRNRVLCGLTAVLAVLAVWMLVFRNTRWWIPLFVTVWVLFYLRYRFWKGRLRFLEDLCRGVLLDFAVKVAYSMLHRYYLAYIYSRFSMHFHTPTVTAYYLLIVSAAALTLFLRKAEGVRGLSLRGQLRVLWKEAFALGMAFSYMVMSLTRSGIGVLAVLVILAAFLAAGSAGKGGCGKEHGIGRLRKRLQAAAGTLLAMFLILCLTFPVAFTGQRLISTVYGQPRRFETLEPYDDWVLRNVEWNCTAFMNIEIFIRDFGDRILGGEIGSKIYYENEWYVPQGYRTADAGSSGICAVEQLASEGELSGGALAKLSDALDRLLLERLNLEELETGSIDNGDVSNGRLGLYLAYIRQLNWTGHDEMGVQLASGEIAVHAHNIFLQTAYDCGIPGGLLLLLAVLSAFAAAFRYARAALLQEKRTVQRGCALLPLLLLTGFFIMGMVEWIFQFSNPYTIAVMLALAPVLVQETAEEEQIREMKL